MATKPVIVHVIDSLARGGAETLLVDLLKSLKDHYDIILVTLTDYSEFEPSEVQCAERISLDYKGRLDFVGAVRRLRKIIRKYKPVLVRSQLYWSTIMARLACPSNIPLVFSVHVTLSDGSFKFNRKGIILKWLEKITYKKRQVLIGVTKEVIADYEQTIGIKGKSYVLHNYVNDNYFSHAINYNFPSNGTLKMVAVGNPKKQKNYELLIRTFRLLDTKTIKCDIYGQSDYTKFLKPAIEKESLPIYLKGKSPTIFEKLGEYDAYIMCSLFEGFGIAVGEAMAVGLPVFLSDLPVLREVSHGNAIFFDPNNEKELAEKINEFRSGKYDAIEMSIKGKAISREHYSRQGYLKKLLDIYRETLAN